MQEQQKQLSLLEEEQLKSSVINVSVPFDKSQGQEAEVQTNSPNDEEDAKTSKTVKHVVTKTQSLECWEENQEDGEKSGFSIRRSRTLPGRLKTTSLELPEDKAGMFFLLASTSHVCYDILDNFSVLVGLQINL